MGWASHPSGTDGSTMLERAASAVKLRSQSGQPVTPVCHLVPVYLELPARPPFQAYGCLPSPNIASRHIGRSPPRMKAVTRYSDSQ